MSKTNPDYRDHPLDMYSIQVGTSRDISTLIDFLPIKLKVRAKKIVFGITGISLGGHVSLLSMGLDKRIAVAAPIIGCGDFLALMKDRAIQNKSIFDDYFPPVRNLILNLINQELVHIVESNDPMHHVDNFKDRPLALISGGADKVS